MKAAYLACGGWVASAVGVAASLGIADLLADGPRTADDLARATGMRAAPLASVLRVLVAVGLFAETAEGTFAQTPDSESLRADHPQSVRAWCMLAAGDYQRLFHAMGHTVATGEPAANLVLGESLYGYLQHTPAAADVYDRAMEDLARPIGGVLAASRDFSGVATVVDVGGGRGTVVRGLLRAVPHLRGTCIDRPEVCDRARRDLEPGLRDRLTFHGGDFFESVPAGADLYILKNVLHNWGDERALAILRPIATALSGVTDGRLLIIEPVIGGGMAGLYRALDDLLQLVICEPGATPRSVEALSTLATQAGFHVTGVHALPSGHTVIEAAVAGT
jgi:C-methyltransferase